MDLTTVDRAVLIAIIAELPAVIERLHAADCRTGRPGETGRPAPDARPQGEIGPEAPSAAGAPQAATPRLRPPAHDTDPPGGALRWRTVPIAAPTCPAVWIQRTR